MSITERHRPINEDLGCTGCVMDWPCDAITEHRRAESERDERENVEAFRDQWKQRAIEAERERDEYKALAEDLAEALRNIEASPQTLDSRLRSDARAALDRYDKDHER